MKRTLVTLVVPLTLAAGCGDDSEAEVAELVVSGKVHVDSLREVTALSVGGDPTGQCEVEDLTGKNVVITDPSGKKVGVVALPPVGRDDPFSAAELQEFADEGLEPLAGVSGTCNLAFEVSVPGGTGVYTAEVEGLPSTKTSFQDSGAGSVVIEADY